MKITFKKEELNDAAKRSMIINIINDLKHGGFMSLNGFKPETGHGEVQDGIFCKGISYPNAVKKSLSMLERIESDASYTVTVTRGTYVNDNGVANPTNRKSKDYPTPKTVTETYKRGDAELEDALSSIRNSLTNPRPVTTEYKKLGNGIYESEDGCLYLRDLRRISKKVIVKGDYPFSASSAKVAIADKIKSDMPVGNYRQVKLAGEFESITMGGVEIAPEFETMKAEVFAEVESVEEVEMA